MEPAESTFNESASKQDGSETWTYPTRFCRICREDVPATVTMYPPGLPIHFQTPIVEYKNDDEYGRLIKPCRCRGSLRYIHELCLLRSRTENTRTGSMWKCHECGHQFNFQRLTIQRLLSSKASVTALTVLFMVTMVFILGFVADPIINIYMDPYDSLLGKESIWEELEVRSAKEGLISAWTQHFAKGFISMGLVGFLKTLFLNPFQWVNLRFGSTFTSSTRATTGRDRAVNISWIAVVIGICSAFVFFYRWVAAIVQRSLQRIGNNIVDTQLAGDDDDLKPPPGWKHESADTTSAQPETLAWERATANANTGVPPSLNETDRDVPQHGSQPETLKTSSENDERGSTSRTADLPDRSIPLMSGSWIEVNTNTTEAPNNDITGVHRQGWSFSHL